MTYRGKVKDGVVVLEAGAELPDGVEVRVEQVSPPVVERQESVGKRLLRHAGKVAGMPRDGARNHEHYLYGTPKQ